MTVEHHPPDVLLAAYAAGTLDLGRHVAVATHLATCPRCRVFVKRMEAVGGAVIEELPPAEMAPAAFAAVEARLGEPGQPARPDSRTPAAEPGLDRLPAFARRYRVGSWTFVAPAVHVRPILLPHASETRVFLLRSGPGTKMLQHTHTGSELTCVLSGAFRQGGERFGPGDFDFGDDTIEHQPIVEPGEPCLCLVAMTGELRLKGLIGRLMQPFLRL